MSALTRIAYGDYPNVTVERGDTVIISAKPVPGNELRVHDSINRLAQHGAEVLHQEIAPVHVSGTRAPRSCGRPLARAAARGHADPRRVPHARRPRTACATRAFRTSRSSSPRTGRSSSWTPDGVRIADRIEAGVTFVDGLGVGDVEDVAPAIGAACRRTVSSSSSRPWPSTTAATSPPELIAAGWGRTRISSTSPRRGRAHRRRARAQRRDRDQARPGAHPRRDRADRLRADAAEAAILPVVIEVRRWPAGQIGAVEANAGVAGICASPVRQLAACEAAAIAFCRLLERWAAATQCPRHRARAPRCAMPPTGSRQRSPARGPSRRVPRRARA